MYTYTYKDVAQNTSANGQSDELLSARACETSLQSSSLSSFTKILMPSLTVVISIQAASLPKPPGCRP